MQDNQRKALPKMHLNLYKTKLCPNLEQGQCIRGGTCKFAHTEEELRKRPDLSKTKLCDEFLKGQCTRGGNCLYAHTVEELRYTDDFFKTSICYNFQ
mmetsp:Transcript_47037/g.65305  ORF Transcript_47037/g.65305 Transcript_47037/m.65305 type:complete len:97 (+) Transcript_47037:114-404(+)